MRRRIGDAQGLFPGAVLPAPVVMSAVLGLPREAERWLEVSLSRMS